MTNVEIAMEYMRTGAGLGITSGIIVFVAAWGFGLVLKLIESCFH